jgi:hypothetical protein
MEQTGINFYTSDNQPKLLSVSKNEIGLDLVIGYLIENCSDQIDRWHLDM